MTNIFAIRTAVAVPANLPTIERSSDLPFKASFTAMAAEIAKTDGMQTADIFVPTTFWTARPKVNADKAKTASYAKDKLRGQFREWQAEEGKVDERKGFALIVVARTGNEPDLKEVTGGVPGTQVWLKAPQATKLPTEEELAAAKAEAPAKPAKK